MKIIFCYYLKIKRLILLIPCIFVLIPPSSLTEKSPGELGQILSTADCIAHLVRFGYLERKDLPEVWFPGVALPVEDTGGAKNPLDIPQKLREAIMDFQSYAGLTRTGQFDEETRFKMLAPRCGNADRHKDPPKIYAKANLNGDGSPRFQLMSGKPKWKKMTLTYRIVQYSEKINANYVDRDIQRAFQYWQKETNLNFVRSSDKVVDIEILFQRSYHKDDFPFDGKNGILAHAFGPTITWGSSNSRRTRQSESHSKLMMMRRQLKNKGGPFDISGDVHFDDDEPWATDNQRGTSLLQVAVHELGHSLGLSHSDTRDAVMYAYMETSVSNQNFRLHRDDVAGIQYLYGKRNPEINTPKPTSPPLISPPSGGGQIFVPPEPMPDLCTDSTFDAITTLNDGTIYLFKGAYYFILDKNGGGVVRNGSARIDSLFKGLPSYLDAATTSPTSGRTYFFKGEYYWRFNGVQPDGNGLPIRIATGFPGIPDGVDAAFVWSGNKNLYFFKGDKYWMYNPNKVPPVALKYPLDISAWHGIPNNIEAAFPAPHGPTFFFKDGQYWRYDDTTFAVAQAEPRYPRATRLFWFGCHKYRPDIEDVVV